MYSAISLPLSFQYLKKLLGKATREGAETIIIMAKGEIVLMRNKRGRGMQTTIILNPSAKQVMELVGDDPVLLYRYTGYTEDKKLVPARKLKASLVITESLETALQLLLEEL